MRYERQLGCLEGPSTTGGIAIGSTGRRGLKLRSRAPYTVHRTDQSIVEGVVALRRERDWGPHS